MNFPLDEDMRRSYYAVNFADFVVKDPSKKIETEIGRELVEDLIRAPSKATLRDLAADRTKRACVAGDFLLSIYGMHSFPDHFSEPSVRKAIFIAQAYAKQTEFGDGSKLPTSAAAIRRCFDDFRSVAHLWAAMRFHQSFPIRNHSEVMATAEAVRDLLGIAGTLQDFGSNFIPKRARPKQPVLDAQSLWRVPDSIKRLHPPWESPPSWLIQTARLYKVYK